MTLIISCLLVVRLRCGSIKSVRGLRWEEEARFHKEDWRMGVDIGWPSLSLTGESRMVFKEWKEWCKGLCEGDLLGGLEEQILESLQQSFSKLKQETKSRGMQPGVLVGILKTTISLLSRFSIHISSRQEFMLNYVLVLVKLLGGNDHE